MAAPDTLLTEIGVDPPLHTISPLEAITGVASGGFEYEIVSALALILQLPRLAVAVMLPSMADFTTSGAGETRSTKGLTVITPEPAPEGVFHPEGKVQV